MCHRQKSCLMTIPYRVRRGFLRFLTATGVLALVAIVALSAWLVWLSRYVVYTDDGAKLDFSLSLAFPAGELAQPPEQSPEVNISYGNSDELSTSPSGALAQLEGWVVTYNMLTKENWPDTKAALQALPANSTVLFDVRNVRGEFFYSSQLGRSSSKVEASAITELFRELNGKGHYLIARFPAFRDRWYFLEDERGRVPYGLPLAGGTGSLWEDVSIQGMSHYWFNPASTGTQNFLVQIVTELRNMGFDEVVLSDFRFPNTSKIKFEGDKAEALNQAAQTLVKACATGGFTVSFADTSITLPQGRCRLYFEDVAAAEIAGVVNSVTVDNPATQIVFLTDLLDTRYGAYSVLRPLDLYTG